MTQGVIVLCGERGKDPAQLLSRASSRSGFSAAERVRSGFTAAKRVHRREAGIHRREAGLTAGYRLHRQAGSRPVFWGAGYTKDLLLLKLPRPLGGLVS